MCWPRITAVALALACFAAAPAAQAQVRQSGTVSPGHVAQWTTSGIIQDGGTSLSGSLTTLGITANGGTPFCINSGPITAAYEQLCLGIGGTGAGTISLGSFGGAPTPGLSIAINGVSSPLISSLIAGTGIAISGTTTPTISLAPIATNTMLANNVGTTQPPGALSLTAFLDSSFGSSTGNIIFRAAGGWQVLAPGANGNCLTFTTGGTPVAWGSCSGTGGTGTVTSITAGTGLTGGTITSSGTIALSSPVGFANGGTNLSSPGANLNALVSNGSAWASSAIVNSLADAANGGIAVSGATGAVSASINPADATLKATPVSTDTILIGDSAASFALKKAAISTLPANVGNLHRQLFFGHTSSATFTPAAGVTAVRVRAGGSGGGGGGGESVGVGLAGTGGFVIEGLVTVSPGVGVTVTIGTGGAGGASASPGLSTAGVTGGDTSFGTGIKAKGGTGGTAASGATATPTTMTQCIGDFSAGPDGTTQLFVPGSATQFGSGGAGGTTGPTNGAAGLDGWMVVEWVS